MEELGITITQLVENNLPAGFTVSTTYINQQTRLWQLMFWDAADVEETDKYLIDMYSDEWVILIGYCILWNIFQKVLSDSFMASVGSISTLIDGSVSTSGAIKKITTGPTDVEYHNGADSLAALIKALKGDGGLLGTIMSMGCLIASKLGIKLPFCPSNKITVPFLVTQGSCGGCKDINQLIYENHVCSNKPASMG